MGLCGFKCRVWYWRTTGTICIISSYVFVACFVYILAQLRFWYISGTLSQKLRSLHHYYACTCAYVSALFKCGLLKSSLATSVYFPCDIQAQSSRHMLVVDASVLVHAAQDSLLVNILLSRGVYHLYSSPLLGFTVVEPAHCGYKGCLRGKTIYIYIYIYCQ